MSEYDNTMGGRSKLDIYAREPMNLPKYTPYPLWRQILLAPIILPFVGIFLLLLKIDDYRNEQYQRRHGWIP